MPQKSFANGLYLRVCTARPECAPDQKALGKIHPRIKATFDQWSNLQNLGPGLIILQISGNEAQANEVNIASHIPCKNAWFFQIAMRSLNPSHQLPVVVICHLHHLRFCKIKRKNLFELFKSHIIKGSPLWQKRF